MSVRLLLADDSEAIQKVISISFADLAVELRSVANKEQALNALHEEPADLVLADARLDGTASASDFLELARLCANNKILLLEGSYDGVDHEAFRAHGLNHIIKKPFETGDLIRYIEDKLNVPLHADAIERSGGQKATPAPGWDGSDFDSQAKAFVEAKLDQIVAKQVESFCRDRFEDIARQVLESELKRLLSERNRQALKL